MNSILFACALISATSVGSDGATAAEARPQTARGQAQTYMVQRGKISVVLDGSALSTLGWDSVVRSPDDAGTDDQLTTFPIGEDSSMALDALDGVFRSVRGGQIAVPGAIRFHTRERIATAGDLTIEAAPDGRWLVSSHLAEPDGEYVAFELGAVLIDRVSLGSPFRLLADLEVSEALARRMGNPNAARTVIGSLMVEAEIELEGELLAPDDTATAPTEQVELGAVAATAGPDVIVGDLYSPLSFGSVSGISAFSVGTISCNVGDTNLSWVSSTNQHPVIAQNMFRLKDGRFEQIGQSWLKHGFFALTGSLCDTCSPPGTGSLLGVGCSDPYSASLNGSQSNLGPKSEVNASTGFFSYPPSNPSFPATIGRRLQVHNSDLDPILNPGASFYIEGQYVTPDDAAAGNQMNNASYRPITVSGGGASFSIATSGTTLRESPAITAWAAVDPTVLLSEVLVPDEGGLIHVASNATNLGTGSWHYEYAIQNLNSHRSAQSFSVPIDADMTISNIGFHDVDYHSGEPYSGTDWAATVSENTITWSTDDFATDSNANALRWGTLYNFRFDANRAPVNTGDVTIGYFRPGTLSSSQVPVARGPDLFPVDCSGCLEAAAPQPGPDAVAKNRFVSFSYGVVDCPTAMRVTLVDLPPPFDVFNGQSMWIDAPEVRCENSGHDIPPPEGCGPAPGLPSQTFAVAGLRCDAPVYSTDWGLYGAVHLYDDVIVPLGTYEIQAIGLNCDINAGARFSAPLVISNSSWGDLVSSCASTPCGAPDGKVDLVTDTVAILAKFSNAFGAPSSARADLWPAQPDFKVDILDALECLAAFTGLEYPYPAPLDPCLD